MRVSSVEAKVGRGGSGRGRGRRVLALVGSPNVGKSVISGGLRAKIAGADYEVVDTPGLYSLLPTSEEERVARRIILEETPARVVHVIDAKNVARMLPLALSLLELGLPLVVDLNIIDEADRIGMSIDAAVLAERLGVPVVKTVGTSKKGRSELVAAVAGEPARGPAEPVRYDPEIERAVKRIAGLLAGEYPAAKRGLALLALQDDHEVIDLIGQVDGPETAGAVHAVARRARERLGQSPSYLITMTRRRFVRELVDEAVTYPDERRRSWRDVLSAAMMNPLTGVPILAAVVYFGLYYFVGVFGAGTLVDFLEGRVFGSGPDQGYIYPAVEGALAWIGVGAGRPGWQGAIHDLVGGDYGVLTLGVRYALAIIMPIVGLFFLFFAVLEDTGYLPRLAMLLDRAFKKIGLNGRAVIPMVLGFGCGTMATMVTRILETRRERIIATLLLALAIPCSAQYAVITGILACRTEAVVLADGAIVGGEILRSDDREVVVRVLSREAAAEVEPGAPGPDAPAGTGVVRTYPRGEVKEIRTHRLAGLSYAFLVWSAVILAVFLVVGVLGARVMPGNPPAFAMELPPLRLPKLGNVLAKTASRMTWYFWEVLPLFMLASAMIWIGRLSRVFDLLIRALRPVMWWLGLPAGGPGGDAGEVFLYGFFRRDFGAGGLYDMNARGELTGAQLVVAAVTLTLFLPCIAQFLVMKKERGWLVTLAMVVFILVAAFGVGGLLNAGLKWSGASL